MKNTRLVHAERVGKILPIGMRVKMRVPGNDMSRCASTRRALPAYGYIVSPGHVLGMDYCSCVNYPDRSWPHKKAELCLYVVHFEPGISLCTPDQWIRPAGRAWVQYLIIRFYKSCGWYIRAIRRFFAKLY